MIGLETDAATQNQIIEQYQENSIAREPKLQLLADPKRPASPQYDDFKLSSGDWKARLCIFCIIMGVFSVPAFLFAGVDSLENNALLFAFGLLSLLWFAPYVYMKRKADQTNQSIKAYYDSAI